MNKAEIRSYLKEKEIRPASEKILDYMSSHIGSVPFATLEQISSDCQATPEEMQEFFSALGFETFIDFKAFLRQANYFEKRDNKLRNTDIHSIADNMMRCELQNLTEFFNEIDYEKLDRLVEDITAASEIVLLGSISYAQYAVYMFNRMGVRTTHIDLRTCSLADFIATLDRSALILPFGFARYRKQLVVTTSAFKKNGFHIVSITDSARSPFAMLADYSFVIPVHSYDLSDSFTSGTLLINLIAYRISLLDQKGMAERMKRYEHLTSELDVFF